MGSTAFPGAGLIRFMDSGGVRSEIPNPLCLKMLTRRASYYVRCSMTAQCKSGRWLE